MGTLPAVGYGIAGLLHVWNAAHGPRVVIAFRLARPAAPILYFCVPLALLRTHRWI